MVTKSCDWIDEVLEKVVAGVENGAQKLERNAAIEISAKWARGCGNAKKTDLKCGERNSALL